MALTVVDGLADNSVAEKTIYPAGVPALDYKRAVHLYSLRKSKKLSI